MPESSTPTAANLDAASSATFPVPSPGAIRAMAEIAWLLKPSDANDNSAIASVFAFDERNQRRPLITFHKELLADADNCRTHHLYVRVPAFTLHVWPGAIPSHVVVVELPLHGDTAGLGYGGREALVEWIDFLSQVLGHPEACMTPEFYHRFIRTLNALDAAGALKTPAPPTNGR